MFDYEILRLIWWALLGILLIGFAVMDGFDLGAATLLPFVGRTDAERRVVINTVGPVWEGNQVWFILGGGAIFAAWPPLYAVAFSGFYLAMFLVLVALILRPVAFKFRSKIEHPTWRRAWDWALFVGGLVPSLIFGVAFGNVLQGVPFRFDETLRMTYEGTLFGLLNPFALLCGLVSVAMLVMHGGAWLALKAAEPVAARAVTFMHLAAIALIALFAVAGLWVAIGIDGYAIVGTVARDGPSNPLLKQVVRASGAWLANYGEQPWNLAAPALAFLRALGAIALSGLRRRGLTLVSSALSVAGVIATAGLSVFPFLLPSSLDPSAGLTVWDASSSRLTLAIMLGATVVFLPLIIAYTAWVYCVLRGRVTLAHVSDTSAHSY
ncbi:cytochrome d ubiquinol oxidase subunit II [Mycobacterium sp. KBS0706]|uniref:cytochrome d ubiquinol oxidase subunit II n=1 Tax=Mycobacterium sp. KBS0706 TaxID=2578109 RepID=UPI00110F9590|nr:cytochrome d ubiquinol oxidase subunit II [Mycobacterium sp. KBS0706]TSD83094.1 cytochrome d ubiquinol oxidase subunit II [Mycobacterium sp. KBS0706]